MPQRGSKIFPSWPLIRSGGCVSPICRKKLAVSNKSTRVAFPSHIRGGFSFCAMLLRGCRATLCIGTAASRLVAKAGSADLADGWLQLVSRRLAYGWNMCAGAAWQRNVDLARCSNSRGRKACWKLAQHYKEYTAVHSIYSICLIFFRLGC